MEKEIQAIINHLREDYHKLSLDLKAAKDKENLEDEYYLRGRTFEIQSTIRKLNDLIEEK